MLRTKVWNCTIAAGNVWSRGISNAPMTLETLAALMKQGFQAMNGRLDTMDGRLDAMDGRLDAMDGRLNAMDGRLNAMDGRLKAVEHRLGSVESKLGFSLEYQVRLEVAREHGRAYANQDSVDCIINLVEHIPSRFLPDYPKSSDIHAKIRFIAMKISEILVRQNVPRKFMQTLVKHLGVDESSVFLSDGSVDLASIRRHPLAADNWTALTQLEDFFKLKKDQAAFMATCKGPGLLMMVFEACPSAIFKTQKLSLYTVLELDFCGRIILFLNDLEATALIDIGECKSTLNLSVIHQLGVRLDVLKLLLEKFVQVERHLLGKKGKVQLKVTKIGRMFVPKATVTQMEQNKVQDSAKESALKKGFSFHLHRL